MNGFINVLKPPGMSSHDVVAWARRNLRQKKIGHTGTLDPGAAGVLVLAIGKATRLSEYVLDLPKSYRCILQFGVATDSGDLYGSVVSEQKAQVSREQVTNSLLNFTGKIEQTPPMTSAVKVKGKKLYQLARQGQTIERPTRVVTIYNLELVNGKFDVDQPEVTLDVSCSKGTYIRSLCDDIGKSIGCGGVMKFLLRTGVGLFSIDDAHTLEQLGGEMPADRYLLPIDQAVKHLAKVNLKSIDQTKQIINGVKVRITDTQIEAANVHQEVAVYTHNGDFMAIGALTPVGEGAWQLAPKKVLY